MMLRRFAAVVVAVVVTASLASCAEATRERSRIAAADVNNTGTQPGDVPAAGAVADPLAGLASAEGGSDPNTAGGGGFSDDLASGSGGADPLKKNAAGGATGGATADNSPTALVSLFSKVIQGTYTVSYRVTPDVFTEMTVGHQGNKDWVTATDRAGAGYWTDFVDAKPQTSCIRDLAGNWSCVPVSARNPDSADPVDALAALGINPVYLAALIIPAIEKGGYKASQATVLGRPATCVAAGVAAVATTVCVDRDGIPLAIRSNVDGTPVAAEATAATSGLNQAVSRQPG